METKELHCTKCIAPIVPTVDLRDTIKDMIDTILKINEAVKQQAI